MFQGTASFLSLPLFLPPILLHFTSKGLHHAEHPALHYLAKDQKMLTEHLIENLPLLASHSLNPSRAYCMFLGVSCQSGMQHPAANPNLPLTLNALPNFQNRVGSLCHHLCPYQKWGFCFAEVLPGSLGCIQQLDGTLSPAVPKPPKAQQWFPPGSLRSLTPLLAFVPSTLLVHCSFHPRANAFQQFLLSQRMPP